MTTIAFQATGDNVNLAPNTSPALCVQLRLPNTGTYVIFGRLVVTNLTTTSLVVSAFLTTLDGATRLDGVLVMSLPPGPPNVAGGASTCISLQSRLDVTAGNANEIVDIRCTASGDPSGSSGFAGVTQSSLMAISVDAFA
jgi:hypothetical protein